jgi:hypothetical protein
MPDQLKHIKVRGVLPRVLVLLPLALALVGAWFSVRWYIGDTIAEFTGNRGLETARLAVRLSPNNPLAHWQLGELESSLLPPEQLDLAIKDYEQAVSLSPNDYRFWLSLGRAWEQAGDTGKADLAMRRAIDLAPSYSYPRWYRGNLLLRGGYDAEAFAELQRASDADPQLRSQVFNLAWAVHAQDFAALQAAIGSNVVSRAEFAKYLIERKAIDDGLRMWNGLSAADKQANRAAGESILSSLIAAKNFPAALGVWNALAPNDAARGTVGQLLNGSFEQDIGPASAVVFGWQVRSVAQAAVALDVKNHHSGAHSLRIVFQAKARVDALQISQLIALEPGKQYDLEFFVKTDKLESAGTPIIEIVDVIDGALLGASQRAPAGDNDWQSCVISFKTSAKTEAVGLRLNRASCGDNATCPIFGTVWYDDFNLKLHN